MNAHYRYVAGMFLEANDEFLLTKYYIDEKTQIFGFESRSELLSLIQLLFQYHFRHNSTAGQCLVVKRAISKKMG